MGTEWGLGPLTIEQTTEDVHVDPPLGREQASEGDGCRATGDRFGQGAEIRDMAGATVCDVSRTSDQNGPEPGHLRRRRARSIREAGASAQTASERDRSAGKVRGLPQMGVPAGWPRRARPAT